MYTGFQYVAIYIQRDAVCMKVRTYSVQEVEYPQRELPTGTQQ